MQRLAEIALNICWKHLTFYFGPSYHRQLSRRFFVSTLRRAKRKIPYYIDALEEFEFDDQTIDNDTVRSIPIIDRDIIIANYPDNLVDPRVKKEDLITTTTSGTSGFPLSFAYGKETHAHRLAVYMRSLTILGYRPWHKVAYLFSRQAVPIYNFGPLFQFIHISSLTEVADQVAEIREKKPDILIGFSSHVLRMAQHCQENAISLRFKFVSVNSEHISETERMFVSEVFHCPVYQSYGSEETWMIASTCRENNWHIFTDNVFLEIVDADGNSVDDGVRGDVLVTTLNTPAMPLIRYRLGDIVMGKSGRCSCGSPFPMLASFEGRSVDRFILSDGREVMPMAIAGVLDSFLSDKPGFFENFKIVQNTVDQVDVEYTAGPSYDPAQATELAGELKRLMSEDVQIDFVEVDRIEQRSQKRRMIESRLARS